MISMRLRCDTLPRRFPRFPRREKHLACGSEDEQTGIITAESNVLITKMNWFQAGLRLRRLRHFVQLVTRQSEVFEALHFISQCFWQHVEDADVLFRVYNSPGPRLLAIPSDGLGVV